MNILIAEDDPTSSYVLCEALKKLGHHVRPTRDGWEALSAFETDQVPLIISDLLMPAMDGLELCRRVRSSDRLHYTYFILLTAAEGKSSYLAGMKAGADDFINKPFDTEMLSARLVVAERILGLQSQVKQLAGLLPICSLCKRVRDDQNYWHQVESYISSRTEATFTHSYCPDCFKKLLREVEAMEPAKAATET